MAGVAVVGGGIKMYQGHQQKLAGERAERDLGDAPEFQIPPEIAKNMSIAEKMEYEGLPAAQKRAFLENQQRTSQAALRSSSDRRGGLGIISQIQGQENLSNRQLLLDDTAARQQNMQRAMDARSVMAGYKTKRFEHQYNEYSADLDYARAQQGAGMQNQQAGVNTMIGGVMQGVGGHLQRKNNLEIAKINAASGNQGSPSIGSNGSGTGLITNTGYTYPNAFTNAAPNALNTYINNNPISGAPRFGVSTNLTQGSIASDAFQVAKFGQALDFYRFPLNGLTE